jgi:uncharacterized membrane protein YhhN
MLPVAVCLVALAALLVAESVDSKSGRAAAKLAASSAFVWAAIEWGAADSAYGQLLLLGLVLCWLGDAFLLPAGQTLWFQLGIGSFLLAHVAYAVAFAGLALEPRMLAASGAVVGIGAWWVLRWLRPNLPGAFRIPVLAYIAAISLMVVVALGAVGAGAPWALGIGAVGFALSDLSVARDRFVASGFFNAAWGLPAYYLSQLALAYSISQVLPAG